MLNRRVFLQRFGIGVGAALTLASLPATAINALTTEQAAKRIACEFLRKRYNDYVGGNWNRIPLSMAVPQGLYDAFEGELEANERFCSGDPAHGKIVHLKFKSAMLFADPSMPPMWDVRFTPNPPKGVEYAMNTTGALIA